MTVCNDAVVEGEHGEWRSSTCSGGEMLSLFFIRVLGAMSQSIRFKTLLYSFI